MQEVKVMHNERRPVPVLLADDTATNQTVHFSEFQSYSMQYKEDK
jgi:hypothetical protein